MNSRLIETLAQVDKQTIAWTAPDGSSALVLPYGGRILGLFAPDSERNFFWTHPALDQVDSARAFYESAEWHNSGGDRTWLSPEVDFFFPRYPDLDKYWQPREFDPGNYQLKVEKRSLVLTNKFSYELSRCRSVVDLEIKKRLTPALNPLRGHHAGASLAYAGYSLRTRLAFTGPRQASAQVGLWSLLQTPHGGSLFIPTLSKSAITPYFGLVDPADLSITDHLICYHMRAAGLQKFGIRAPSAIGRAGYLYRDGKEYCLVIRNFSINPSGDYVDVPCREPDAVGSVIEACNVNCELGAFSELEHHAPAIGGPMGEPACEEESQLWAFRGLREDVLEATRLLISGDL